MPYIDPPDNGDIINNAGEASRIEDSRLEAGFEEPNYSIPRYDEIENDGYRSHPSWYKLYEADSKGNVRKVRSKRQILSELNGEIMIRDHRTGNKGLVGRSMFVWECYYGMRLRYSIHGEFISLDKNIYNCDIMNLDIEAGIC